MAKPATPFTTAVRTLLEKHGEALTHSEAREHLKGMEVEMPDGTYVIEIAKEGTDEFTVEQNSFNVTKSYWKKHRGTSGKASRKPGRKSSKKVATTASKPAAKHGKKRGRKPTKVAERKSEFEVEEAIEYVRQNGGAVALAAKLEALKAQVAEVSAALNVFDTVQKQMSAAA